MIAILQNGRLVGLAPDPELQREMSRVRRSLGLEDKLSTLRGLAQAPERGSEGQRYKGYKAAA